jgi:two-component system response regulator YesN
MKIVIVDDEKLERMAIKKMLDSETNFEVIGEAANGRLAIELVETVQPDVMLMDIKMPGINGLEAIQLIQQKKPNIRFIIVSAFDTFEYAKEAMKYGVKEYILKPSKKEEVITALLTIYKELQQEKRKLAEQDKIKKSMERVRSIVEGLQETSKAECFQAVKEGRSEKALEACKLYFEECAIKYPAFTELKKAINKFIEDLRTELQEVKYGELEVINLEEQSTDEDLFTSLNQYVLNAVQHVNFWRNHDIKNVMNEAKKYIEKHYAENLTLEDLASYMEISPHYFSKLFKGKFQITFIDYLTDIRVGKAKKDLLGSNKSLKEISIDIGYKDPNYFSRVFKKKTGKSPTEYRELHT